VSTIVFKIPRGEFPTDAGVRLANEVLDYPSHAGLKIDLTHCRPSDIISAFFSSFMRRIAECDPTKIEEARQIEWSVAYEFQEKMTLNFVTNWQP
jgi:hypothetical protein